MQSNQNQSTGSHRQLTASDATGVRAGSKHGRFLHSYWVWGTVSLIIVLIVVIPVLYARRITTSDYRAASTQADRTALALSDAVAEASRVFNDLPDANDKMIADALQAFTRLDNESNMLESQKAFGDQTLTATMTDFNDIRAPYITHQMTTIVEARNLVKPARVCQPSSETSVPTQDAGSVTARLDNCVAVLSSLQDEGAHAEGATAAKLKSHASELRSASRTISTAAAAGDATGLQAAMAAATRSTTRVSDILAGWRESSSSKLNRDSPNNALTIIRGQLRLKTGR